MSTYLKKRGGKYHFQKRVPQAHRKLVNKEFVAISLGTDSRSLALHRAHNFNLVLEDFWSNLVLENVDKPEKKFMEAVKKAKACGFQYISKDNLVHESSIIDFVNRINTADSIENEEIKEALIGGVEKPSITLTKSKDKYFDFQSGNQQGKSEAQIKKWKTPRSNAIENFVMVIGKDKSIDRITREDVLNFRSWWIEKIKTKGRAANTANKQFGFVKEVVSFANDNYLLDISIDDLFKGIRLKEVEKTVRYPFTNSFIKDKLFDPDIQLNLEARMLIFAMADTGARIQELTGLDEENGDIILNAEIPYIKIRPNDIRSLKTPQSERDIPLVGASLFAFETLGGSFKRYLGKSDLISNTINKFFRDNDILPSENHSLYSLRHSYEDRLTAVEPPDKVQASLMGHKYSRPRYGLGPTLEQKKFWLDKIAFKVCA